MRGTANGARSRLILLAFALCAFAAPGQAPAQGAVKKHVYGSSVRALLLTPPGIEVQSQLGGGDTTVLYVTNIKYASGEDGVMVHFTIDNGTVTSGKTINLVLPVLKDLLVHERGGGRAHRPVVAMNFCIGSVAFSSNVTLEPRTSFTAPLLLGRADAARFAPIDPRKKDTGAPDCQAPPAAAP